LSAGSKITNSEGPTSAHKVHSGGSPITERVPASQSKWAALTSKRYRELQKASPRSGKKAGTRQLAEFAR